MTALKTWLLVAAAPPRTLGDLRAHLPEKVRVRIAHEFPKDLTHFAPHALAAEIARLLGR